MFIKNIFCPFIVLIWLAVFFFFSRTGESSSFKVLVVMSYHESMPWVKEIKEGIDSEMEGACDLKYFYMDTKRKLEGGPQKAREAYAMYLDFRPGGVIAADDNAQSMFVVPYLKDKVKTPVMFCGVNSEPDKYGYPASNVTGILERTHISESIALIQLLVPSVKTIGYILKDSTTAKGVFKQIQRNSKTYSAKSVAVKFAKTLKEAMAMTEELKNQCDALHIEGVEGLLDVDGNPLPERDVIPILAKIFGKPATSPDVFNIKYGLLCTVSKTGQEQGGTAAKMLLESMKGTPVSEMPIARNRYGKRVINVTVMKELGIKPRPIVLRGAELVRTEK